MKNKYIQLITSLMAIISFISTITVWVLLLVNLFAINNKLERLIELNIPEYINIVPDKPLLEK